IMPFITEEVYGELPHGEGDAPMIIVAPWPDANALAAYVDEDAERAIAMVCEVVGAIRSTRSRYGISPKVALPVAVKVDAESDATLLLAQAHLIGQLANVEEFDVAVETSKPAESAVVLGTGLEVYVVLAGHVDFEAERARLVKERDGLAKDAAKFEKKLSNPGFLAKAAPEIVEKDKAKLADLTDKLQRLEAQIAELG
ncbi:MAG: class I tRNA ligase family protein, partial [Adlercreutzia sp.]|nr:class I tRNA ligase family protein [Adlercreutzia sp.]